MRIGWRLQKREERIFIIEPTEDQLGRKGERFADIIYYQKPHS